MELPAFRHPLAQPDVQCPICRILVHVVPGDIEKWTQTGVEWVARQMIARDCPRHFATVRVGDG